MEQSKTREKRRVLVVCQHFWPESFRINDICEGFIENDIEVDVLCGKPNYPKGEWFDGYSARKPKYEEHNGIRVYRTFEIRRKNNTSVSIFLNYMSFPFASRFHVRRLSKNKYDKVFIYSLSPVYMGIAGLKIAKRCGCEAITCVMDLWPDNLYSVINFKNKLIRKILYKTSTKYYIKSDKLICLTERAKEVLMERTGKEASAFRVIPQYCEKIYETHIDDPELAERFGGKFNMVYTGNISPAQNLPLMIEAAGELRKRGLDINWIIVGDGMSRAESEALVKERGLSEIFFFEGMKPVSDMPKYTKIASGLIACLTPSSLLECTVPAKVTSYIASARPIILSMDGEAQQIVNSSNIGFAAPSGDLTALCDNIERLYKMSADERAEMGERARVLHNAEFERSINLKKIIDFMFDGENNDINEEDQ